MFVMLFFFIDKTFIRRGSKQDKRIVGTLLDTNSVPLPPVTDLFLFYYEKDNI